MAHPSLALNAPARVPLGPAVGLGLLVGAAVPLLVLVGWGWQALAWVGVFLLLVFLLTGRNADLFSPPVLFTILWILCAGIGAQIVSIHQRPWTPMVWACVIAAPLSFWMGDWVMRLMSGSVGERFAPLPQRVPALRIRPLVIGGVIWFVLAALMSAHEWRTLVGTVPLFADDWEQSRMLASEGHVGRAIHAVAYSGILLAIVMQVGIFSQPRLLARSTWPLWALLGASLFLAACWGSRHTLFIPLAAGAVAFNAMRVRLGIGHLVGLALTGIVFIAGVQYIRQVLVWEGEDMVWREVLDDIGYVGWPAVAAQLHQTFAMNFEIFRQITETFPTVESYHLGGFTFHWLLSLLPGQQLTLAQWQNLHWNTGFYGTLTSTHMGSLYADFGIMGVILWTAMLAALMRWLYVSYRRRPSAVTMVWFSYLMTQVIMLPYDNTLVKLATVLNFIILWVGLTALGVRRAGELTEEIPRR